eukprot:scaffold42659_cov62-Phaeocystis_antarctica.AAC.9
MGVWAGTQVMIVGIFRDKRFHIQNLVASRGLMTCGGTAVGAIEGHVQCTGDRRVAGVARWHVRGHNVLAPRYR